MKAQGRIVSITLIVALGGLLMGFDASVISGVVKFIEPEFNLSKLELGWSVASLTLTSTLAMMIAGPLSDRFGRREVLKYAAVLYAISAIGSALAPNFIILVIARMIGGFGVGASLIIAPMYIAEIAPPEKRGKLVSFNQLNIVIGISLAFFTNYLILRLGASDAAWTKTLMFDEYNWRWMLGLETLPAVIYFVGLFAVPKSPRWLIMHGNDAQGHEIMLRYLPYEAEAEFKAVKENLNNKDVDKKANLSELLKPALRLVLSIGVVVAILQQITGINSVFFYAPMIFEQSGIGTDASFVQAIIVGITNLGFTVVAILFIDRIGRKPLLTFGVSGIAISMLVLAYGFGSATYQLTTEKAQTIFSPGDLSQVESMLDKTYDSDLAFKGAIIGGIGQEKYNSYESAILKEATHVNSTLILGAIIAFVASFAVSLGPVMWVLFSELFPNYIRGIAISFVGLINSGVSFVVQWIFPWELASLGNSMTFLIYGLFAVAGLIFIIRTVPETKGKSLEELEKELVR